MIVLILDNSIQRWNLEIFMAYFQEDSLMEALGMKRQRHRDW